MRILILNYEFPPLGGGAANATKYILEKFSKYNDLEIDLVTSSVDKFKIQKFSKNITIYYLDINKKSKNLHNQSNKDLIIYSIKAYFYSKKLIKKKEFNLIHAFFGIPCGFIAKKLKLPYIVSLRGSDVPFYSQKYKYLDKLFFKNMSKKIWADSQFVIANSNGLKELAKKTSPSQKIDIIYNGIDTKEFVPNKTKSKQNKKLKVLCVGRLIQRKGYSYLIDAIKPIQNNFSVTFIGDGPLRSNLENQSKNLDVEFLGLINHEKLSKIYPRYDIFILPSFNEGMSNTVLEAMASSLAIITTNTGGTKELINNNGFIIRAGNSKDITKTLKLYLNNKYLLQKHKKNSRQIAKKMSWDNVAKEYYDLYEKSMRE
jgi:glycosyltransferase involved in cell wall biosynthesis